ncbi:unnamed protein product [Citrullus colocynthis]|uniref:Uncharacterized protein n=1 Tax=Citrullus colocynthis TaxID=252529 RepID=A0ABP0YA06_9ROSI
MKSLTAECRRTHHKTSYLKVSRGCVRQSSGGVSFVLANTCGNSTGGHHGFICKSTFLSALGFIGTRSRKKHLRLFLIIRAVNGRRWSFSQSD